MITVDEGPGGRLQVVLLLVVEDVLVAAQVFQHAVKCLEKFSAVWQQNDHRLIPFQPAIEQPRCEMIDPLTQIVYPGQQIFIPNPDLQLPTATPIPANMAKGTVITYVVQSGDSLAGIAGLFNSTVEDIVELNELTDANAIFVGQQLDIRVNLVTATATRPPTSTPRTPIATGTPTAG
jgi:hypothetical protein